MDSEPSAASRYSPIAEVPSKLDETSGRDPEDPFSLNGTSIAILGLTIGLVTIGVPLLAVFTDRPMGGASMVPTALELDGPKTSRTITITRPGESFGRDPSR